MTRKESDGLIADHVSGYLPLVSIVTVVRNGLPFVRDTIASVREQDYAALEYWMIDGGSNDGTVDIIKDARQFLAGWVSEPDHGISDAFNKGLMRTSGDYVMFLNADDALASPVSISRLVAAAKAAGWPDVIYGDCDLIDRQAGTVLYRAAIDYDRARFLKFGMMPHPSMLVHKRYFERYGHFDVNFRIGMDYELLLRGVPDVGAIRLPELITRVRTGGESTLNPHQVVEENLRALRKNGHLRSEFEAWRIRIYFRIRFALRGLLETLGLYRRPGNAATTNRGRL